MSLSLALSNALTGLQINQQALSTLSHNIANANTVGYSRQLVNQEAQYIEGVGVGVRLGSITRQVDLYLQRSLQTQSSNAGRADVISNYMDRMQILLGEPGRDNSIDAYIGNFFNALQGLATTPELASNRSAAVAAGNTLATQLSSLATSLQELRYEADRDISQVVKDVNAQLRRLYSVNTAIDRAHVLGAPTAGLLDERDAAIEEISKNLDVRLTYKDSGAVDIYTVGGIALLDNDLHQLTYSPAASSQSFIDDVPLSPIQVIRLSQQGNQIGDPVTLVSGGVGSQVMTGITTGKLKGLLELRDTDIPNTLNQLDSLAAVLRDEINAIHNEGSGYPGAFSYTGTRAVSALERNEWTGSTMIALLDQNGNPVAPPYANQFGGYTPLTLDLSSLESGYGVGAPSVQTIIDEINWHYGTPQNRVSVGTLDNIRLVSDSEAIPGVPPAFAFDFELENLDIQGSTFFVSNVTVLDDTATDITSVTTTAPNVALAAVGTFTTTGGSNVVTVTTAAAHGLVDGTVVHLSDPGVAVDGIAGSEFDGYFVISNVTSTSFDIEVVSNAAGGPATDVAGQVAIPPYQQVDPGEKIRSRDSGQFTADLSGNAASAFYDVQVTVGVRDDQGNVSESTITYRVSNNELNLLNDRYAARAVSGSGTLTTPTSTQPLLRAMLVDENGVEIPKVNGNYIDQPGYLKLQAGNSNYVVSISNIDSVEVGSTLSGVTVPGTGRGFSHYFELNNFFQSHDPSATGDTVKGSAINLTVEQRLRSDPNLITTGQLVQSNQPANPNSPPLYTYERHSGSNQIAQRLSQLSVSSLSFSAAGGLPATTQSIGNYAGQILGFAASQASFATSVQKDNDILLNSFAERAQAVSGVNLDEELANTVIYQNAYGATARVISIANDLFNTLINTFQ